MNRARVLGRVAEVRQLAEQRMDNEAAHEAEDRLWHSVLVSIAEGTCEDDPADLARIALRTDDIPFIRWYA